MVISESMYKYLKSYVKWVENGSVNSNPYLRRNGLCDSTRRFTNDPWSASALMGQLMILFEEESLNSFYPFGKENYVARAYNKTQHEDPLRLKWINDHILEYEEINNI